MGTVGRSENLAMTKKHFEYMAWWIALNTQEETKERLRVEALTISTAEHFNSQFDEQRFIGRITDYDSGRWSLETRARVAK